MACPVVTELGESQGLEMNGSWVAAPRGEDAMEQRIESEKPVCQYPDPAEIGYVPVAPTSSRCASALGAWAPPMRSTAIRDRRRHRPREMRRSPSQQTQD